MIKVCRKCGKPKPVAEFYRHPQTADGYEARCKACAKSNVQAAYARNREARHEYERTRRSRPAEYKPNADPLKRAARVAVGNAIRDGRLVRQPCDVCGSEIAEGHHEDYSRPLAVRWLCFKHHRTAHGQYASRKVA